ncbi:MAG: hypothetical protein DRO09_03425 [Thermoprotei archaeon]|nr:MAG: hypothetical protein DRO09_03425 [Thermoprotei archaeon]
MVESPSITPIDQSPNTSIAAGSNTPQPVPEPSTIGVVAVAIAAFLAAITVKQSS